MTFDKEILRSLRNSVNTESLKEAIQIGNTLLRKKEMVKSQGFKWMSWVALNINISLRSCQNYMNIAKADPKNLNWALGIDDNLDLIRIKKSKSKKGGRVMSDDLKTFCELLSVNFLESEFTKKEVTEKLKLSISLADKTVDSYFNDARKAKYIQVVQEKQPLGHGRGYTPAIYTLDSVADYETINQVKLDMGKYYRMERKKKKFTSKSKRKTSKATKIIKNCSPDKETHNKEYVEAFFLSSLSKYISNARCLIVCGPDYHRHMNILFNSIAKEVFIAEIEENVYDEIVDSALACQYYKAGKVSLFNCSIGDILLSNSAYIDIDLMATIGESLNFVQKHLDHQMESMQGIKALTFTVSVRNGGDKLERFNVLKDLLNQYLGASLVGFDGILNGFSDGVQLSGALVGDKKHCLKHIPNFTDSGRILEMHLFNYSDNCPMVSVLLIYQ